MSEDAALDPDAVDPELEAALSPAWRELLALLRLLKDREG